MVTNGKKVSWRRTVFYDVVRGPETQKQTKHLNHIMVSDVATVICALSITIYPASLEIYNTRFPQMLLQPTPFH